MPYNARQFERSPIAIGRELNNNVFKTFRLRSM